MNNDNNMPYTVSEWEWFQLQLQLHLARHKTESYYIGLEEPGTMNSRPLRIRISEKATEYWITQKKSKNELLQMNMVWVYFVRDLVPKLLEYLPALKADFDISKDIIFELLCDTGKASHKIAEVIGNEVAWVESLVKDLPE